MYIVVFTFNLGLLPAWGSVHYHLHFVVGETEIWGEVVVLGHPAVLESPAPEGVGTQIHLVPKPRGFPRHYFARARPSMAGWDGRSDRGH